MPDYASLIRAVPDFPKPGILFRDITPLLDDGKVFGALIQELVARYRGQGITKVAGMESRGFLFGTPLAIELAVGFVPLRKPGKLPAATYAQSYALEYGEDSLEIHQDALTSGDMVLVVDDLLATGGTARAACELIEKCGASVAGVWCMIELEGLAGRARLGDYPFEATLKF